MKNANLVEQTCQCLPGPSGSVMKADGQVHRSVPGGFALTSYVARTSPSSHTATCLSFSAPREPEFPHNDMLAKLAELGDAFSFFTQIFFSIGENNLSLHYRLSHCEYKTGPSCRMNKKYNLKKHQI